MNEYMLYKALNELRLGNKMSFKFKIYAQAYKQTFNNLSGDKIPPITLQNLFIAQVCLWPGEKTSDDLKILQLRNILINFE